MTEGPTKTPQRKQRPQAQTADFSQKEASPSAETQTSEALRETASPTVSQQAPSVASEGSATGLPPFARPELIVRPEPASTLPERKASEARAPWLPPSLSELVPRLALPAALVAIPIAAAFALQAHMSRTHSVYDDALLFPDGSMDKVTALQWSGQDGALLVGTRSGSVKSIGSDGVLASVLEPGDVGTSDVPSILSPVQSFSIRTSQGPLIVFQDRASLSTAGPANAFAVTPTSSGVSDIQGGLFAAVEANNGSAVVGRAVVADSRQQFELPNNVFNAPNQLAPQQQQQQIQPTGEPSKGESAPPEQMPVDPTGLPSAPPRYGISLFRDLQSGSATAAGEIFGIEDVRGVAALPGTNTVIAGDGEGNVFAIDASEQISGVSPETYIRGIGQHEAAIVEIAVAAQPGDQAVLFATRAEDRTIKVWRGSVSRASQLLPLGDYPNAEVTTPGSTWVREPIQVATRPSRAADPSLAALLSMSDDGRRILARRANRELVILDLPAQGEDAAATEYDGVNYVTEDTPAMLSPDGSRLVAANAIDSTVEMSEVVSGQASRLAVASFRGLADNQFRSFAFDGTGRRFVAIAASGSIYVQNIETPDQAITIGQYQGPDIEAAISPDGSLVAVADARGQIMIHSVEDGSELTRFGGPQNLASMTFDSAGKHLRAVGDDRGPTGGATIFTYSLRNSRSTTYIAGFHPDQSGDGFIPSGDRYFMRDGDAGYSIVDIDSGAEVGTLLSATGATGWVSNLDGSRIATLGGRGNVSLFREEESAAGNGPMPAMADNALRLSADGRTLAVGGRASELYLARLDGDAGDAGYRLRRLALPAPSLQYDISPDGTSIVIAQADGTVRISDLPAVLSAPDAPANRAPADAEPASGVTVVDIIEISGHGAPLTAMALSPDGELLATASLDGRLRITDVAWARFVHRLPFSALPSGPEHAPLEAQPLDDSPYALMGEPPTSGDGGARPYVVVYNARKLLGQALGARDRAAEAGFPYGLVYRRQGFFRGVFAYETAEARDAALPEITGTFPGAYSRNLENWCPNAVANDNFFDCATNLAGNAPPAMAN